jgi:Tfp pilus assembly protein PilF
MEILLNDLIAKSRKMMASHEYSKCEKLIRKAMEAYPDNAIPHNIMGILYESRGDHIGAMKHFRAAWALDPTYRPSLMNLENFGKLFSDKTFIFDEPDEEGE